MVSRDEQTTRFYDAEWLLAVIQRTLHASARPTLRLPRPQARLHENVLQLLRRHQPAQSSSDHLYRQVVSFLSPLICAAQHHFERKGIVPFTKLPALASAMLQALRAGLSDCERWLADAWGQEDDACTAGGLCSAPPFLLFSAALKGATFLLRIDPSLNVLYIGVGALQLVSRAQRVTGLLQCTSWNDPEAMAAQEAGALDELLDRLLLTPQQAREWLMTADIGGLSCFSEPFEVSLSFRVAEDRLQREPEWPSPLCLPDFSCGDTCAAAGAALLGCSIALQAGLEMLCLAERPADPARQALLLLPKCIASNVSLLLAAIVCMPPGGSGAAAPLAVLRRLQASRFQEIGTWLSAEHMILSVDVLAEQPLLRDAVQQARLYLQDADKVRRAGCCAVQHIACRACFVRNPAALKPVGLAASVPCIVNNDLYSFTTSTDASVRDCDAGPTADPSLPGHREGERPAGTSARH